MGGWSVYLVVNGQFERANRRRYSGSRDIDIGFHFDPKWDTKEFENSSLSKTIAKIQKMGFENQSFRFVKRFADSGKRELTQEESRSLPLYDIFNLYIDLLVDSGDPKRIELAGFPVAEETLLSRVFAGGESMITKFEGLDVMIPHPQLLMEMKVKSFPDRTQDDKRTKDIIDLCALLTYSGYKPPIINGNIEGKSMKERYKQAVEALPEPEWAIAASALAVTEAQARRIANLIR